MRSGLEKEPSQILKENGRSKYTVIVFPVEGSKSLSDQMFLNDVISARWTEHGLLLLQEHYKRSEEQIVETERLILHKSIGSVYSSPVGIWEDEDDAGRGK